MPTIHPRFTIALATLLALGALGSLVPLGSAQAPCVSGCPASVQIKITPYDQPIKPLSGLAVLTADVTYSYFAAGETALIATPVSLKVVDQPSWAVITISPSTLLFPITQNAASQISSTEQAKILITATADAPAFTGANIKISATAAANSPIGAAQGDDQTLIQADYFSIIDAQTAEPIKLARPQTAVVYPITITNFGNANTKISFDIVQAASNLQVIPPQQLTLEARQTGGKLTSSTANLQIQTPYHNGYLNEIGTVTLKISGAYALNSQIKGDSSQVSVLATTRGFYVPGVEGPLFLAILGLAAVVLKRRK